MSTKDDSVNRMLTRRADLLYNKTVPSHDEAMSHLGTFLGEIVLNEMTPMAKEMMGIGTPFPVAPKKVWLPPSDRMDGKIVLKPPPNEDVIKALTHEGILEIGSTVEERLEKIWQEKLKAAKKEVEDFERFECNNRIKFALQQEKLAHEAALKQQRTDLLKMFQKDREELIVESQTELDTLRRTLDIEHKTMRDRDIRLSVKQMELSSNDKINELTERVCSLEDELEDMEKMVHAEVEKRKHRDWKILREMFFEMLRQFTTKLTFLQEQHNAEIRQLYLEVRNKSVESLGTTTFNEDSSWEEENFGVELEQENTEYCEETKPFVISVCKVEGESSEEEISLKGDNHSTGSSFKCHKHRSKPQSEVERRGRFESKLFHVDSQSVTIGDLHDINTTDISCNILRRLGLNFNVGNIEKVKVEIENLLLNFNKRGEPRLLAVTDSLDLIASESAANELDQGSKESASTHERETRDRDREEYKRLLSRKKAHKVIDSKLAVPLTVEEYMSTLTPFPKYMAAETGNISIWDYKTMSDEEWNNLVQELDNNLQADSTESNSKNKNVTVTSPNSMESLVESGKMSSRNVMKRSRGILRSNLGSKIDSESMLKNEIFQTNEMQSLVEKLSS